MGVISLTATPAPRCRRDWETPKHHSHKPQASDLVHGASHYFGRRSQRSYDLPSPFTLPSWPSASSTEGDEATLVRTAGAQVLMRLEYAMLRDGRNYDLLKIGGGRRRGALRARASRGKAGVGPRNSPDSDRGDIRRCSGGRDDQRTIPQRTPEAVPSPTSDPLNGGVPWIAISGDVRVTGRSRIDG